MNVNTAQQNAAYVGIVNYMDRNTTMAMKCPLVVNALLSSSTELQIHPLRNQLQNISVCARNIFKWLQWFSFEEIKVNYVLCLYF